MAGAARSPGIKNTVLLIIIIINYLFLYYPSM
jgi:hypothetical protein